jgi:hypothetical protein
MQFPKRRVSTPKSTGRWKKFKTFSNSVLNYVANFEKISTCYVLRPHLLNLFYIQAFSVRVKTS